MNDRTPTFDTAGPPDGLSLAGARSGGRESDWAPKRRLTLDSARQHSRRVRIFQLVLLALAALLVVELVRQFTMRQPSTFEEPDPSQTVTMMKPRYIGRTADGLPYTLTADSATRARTSPDEVDLNVPLLNFYRIKGVEASTIDALSGVYNDKSQVLNLRTDVVLTTDDGNICTTTHARLFMKTKTIEGDEPIRCTGEFGTMAGNAFEIRDEYKTFVFKNGMEGVIEPDDAPSDPDFAGATPRDEG